MTEANLEKLRTQIDDIDVQIADLFKQRMVTVLEIAGYKQAHGMEILNSDREQEILDKISARFEEPLDEYARLVFTSLFEVSKDYQSRCLNK